MDTAILNMYVDKQVDRRKERHHSIPCMVFGCHNKTSTNDGICDHCHNDLEAIKLAS